MNSRFRIFMALILGTLLIGMIANPALANDRSITIGGDDGSGSVFGGGQGGQQDDDQDVDVEGDPENWLGGQNYLYDQSVEKQRAWSFASWWQGLTQALTAAFAWFR